MPIKTVWLVACKMCHGTNKAHFLQILFLFEDDEIMEWNNPPTDAASMMLGHPKAVVIHANCNR